MNMGLFMKRIFLITLLLLTVSELRANELKYHGKWNTTNRRLDGEMSCVVTKAGTDKLKAHFWGTWQGVYFEYDAYFVGKLTELKGQAVIDGASYNYAACIDKNTFKCNFVGSRYNGSFELKRTAEKLVKIKQSKRS